MNKFRKQIVATILAIGLRKNHVSLIIGFFIISFGFQNCTKLDSISSADFSSVNLPIEHPTLEQKTLPSSQKLMLAHRNYIVTLFKDIFESENYTIRNSSKGSLDDILEHWIGHKGTQFGLACDPYSSQSTADCAGDISNANGAIIKDDGTLRESYRLKACRDILDSENAVEAALEKINRSSQIPNKSSVIQIYELFYRDTNAGELTVNSLLELDRELSKANESVYERWRALLLVVCESPGWQML